MPKLFPNDSTLIRLNGGGNAAALLTPLSIGNGDLKRYRVFSKISRPISMRRISLVPAPIS